MHYLLMILLLTGCSYFEKHDSKPDQVTDLTALRAKYNTLYQEVESGLTPETGWIEHEDCDGLLFNSLACAVGFPVNIGLAEYSPGEMHRRPFKACWTEESGDVGSKSTISRDMLTGYMSCLWARRDLAALQRLADYGEQHDWIMGKPETLVSRVFMGGNLIGLLGRAVYTLSAQADNRYYRRTGYLYPPETTDYGQHIALQGILLQDQVDSSYNLTAINSEMLDRLIENANAFPSDPLFAAALGRFTGDQSKTLALLMAEEMTCPSYARGEKPEVYCKLNWLQSAKIILGDI